MSETPFSERSQEPEVLENAGAQHSPPRSRQTEIAALTPTLIKTPLSLRVLRALHAVWRAVTANPKVALGSAIIGFFVLVALIGPFFMPYDPHFQDKALTRAAPSAAHLLGTTQLGEDVFSQLIYGARTSIFWGLATGLAVTLLSIVIGLVSGYFGGFVDDCLTLLTNVFLVLPPLPLAIALSSYLQRGAFTVAMVVTFTSWAWGARVLRAQTLSLRNREFVTASQASGETTLRIIFFEIFPNEISIVAANFVSTTLYVIIAIASLEFLGLGDLSSVSWGSMLYWSQKTNALLLGSWWWFVPPGLCIALLGAGLALINFGIDEVADPRLRAVRLPRLRKRTPESEPLADEMAKGVA